MSIGNEKVLVSFDIDGTLMICDNARVHRAAFRAATYALTGEDKPVEEYLGIPLSGCSDSYCAEQVLKKYFKAEPTTEQFEAYMKKTEDVFLETFDNKLDVMPGVPHMLEELNKLPNVTLAVCSGNYPRIGWKKLEAANLTKFFPDKIAGWGFHPNRADMLRDAIESAKKLKKIDNFQRIIHVGDAPQDAQAAIDTGSTAVIVRTSRHSFKTEDFPQPSFIIQNFEKNLEEFLKIVKTGNL